MKNILSKFWLGILIFVVFTIAVLLIYHKINPEKLADNLIEGSGRIDGDLINLNAKYAGRLSHVNVEEGDSVIKEEVVARLYSQEYEAQKEQISAEIDAKQKELNGRKIELSIARKSIPQALEKARSNLEMQMHGRDELDQTLNIQKSALAQSERDWERTNDLVSKRLIEERQLEISTLKLQADRDQLSALEYKRKQIDEAANIARSSLIEAEAEQSKLAVMEEGIKALEAGMTALRASLERIDSVLDEMELRSPINGYVVEKISHGGEVVGSGSPVLTLIDPSSLYLKIFVDTLENGKLKLGDQAVIFLDAVPEHPIAAKVVRIEQKAEFTPKEVSVPSDRIQRVFAVHLKPLKPEPLLKLGLPAVGVVSLDGKGLPTTLREIPQ